ncbi:transcriptional regulator [Bifidobacterium pseudolongum subsp. globosum]|uniref:hypothetical protein n=1 Tax=Bifidobacterium pseudolongum TaxID=1694 RepID=UPI000CC82FD5|nr:hypothetical protein [Bifidobacterium pseudolongum]PKV02847.1 transcriptional regulator [Bifidobacterium pseudolongum subsp. globosum]RYQ58098.1 transcriptional regulator [Bifidobacterium pseudolongum subsp. globosum]RYQ61975.1 transcriptional regulator [Bifidobacterium pseudolongum subsp. globosum]
MMFVCRWSFGPKALRPVLPAIWLTRRLRLINERFMTRTRTPVAIAGPANRIDFYATFLHSNCCAALPIQQYLAQHWPQAA